MKSTFAQFFVEKYVIGLIETIHVKGVGTVEAKVDSGNGGFNVLHGEDIQVQGSKVTFVTANNKRVMKPIVDHVTINVGAGNQEDRPVVEFDVQIGDRRFENVKFSIGNRSDNSQKVLISKSFIQDELDALIDVGVNNVASKGIEVDYGNTSDEDGMPATL
jgi:hypothetical protein